MKKRVLCLCLCLLMVLPMLLSACSGKTSDEATDDIQESASESAVTLTMWVVADEKPSDATASAVNKAVNAITQSKFKVQLLLQYYTEDEYQEKLENALANYSAARKKEEKRVSALTTETGETEQVTDETVTNEYNLSVIKYPDVLENQVDILYIGDLQKNNGTTVMGEDLLHRYADEGWLADISKEIAGSSKKLNEYVSPALMAAAQYNGATYAVPNNNVVGEYTYMLIDKQLFDKYQYQGKLYKSADGSYLNNFYNETVYNFLDEVAEYETGAAIPVAKTVLGTDGQTAYDLCLGLLARYWSLSEEDYQLLNEFSVFGSYITDAATLSRSSTTLKCENLFQNKEFTAAYLKLNQMFFNGYFDEAEETEKPAIQFITGDTTILSQYKATLSGSEKKEYKDTDEYYAVIVKYPTASTEDVFSSMFGVCNYTKSLTRSMQILTYLNTNADFRNLLQYGVEDVNYKVEDGRAIYLPDNDYLMDIYKTGNVFMAYPDETMDAEIWTRGKAQNRSALIDPLLGFSVKDYATASVATETTSGDKYLTATSGYSKDMLSENADLKEWLKGCDAAGKGVYIYQTSDTDETYATYNIYVYNSNLTRKVTCDVSDTALVNADSSTQYGTELKLTYSNAVGTSYGYDITLISARMKKSLALSYTAAYGEETYTPVVSEGTLITVDFMNSSKYSITRNDLRVPDVAENSALMQWLHSDSVGVRSKNSTKAPEKQNNVGIFTEVKDGKKYYTLVVYTPELTKVTSVSIQPRYEGNSLTLNLMFEESEESYPKDVEDNFYIIAYPNYVLTYITVVADENVSIGYKLNQTSLKTNETTFAQDPDFDYCGNLDTEIWKFMQEFDSEIVALLKRYTVDATGTAEEKYEALAELVTDLQKLFTCSKSNYATTLKNVDLKNFLDTQEAKTFYYGDETVDYLTLLKKYATVLTSEAREHEIAPAPGAGNRFEDYPCFNGEAQTYFESPFGLYILWAQANGYAAKTK